MSVHLMQARAVDPGYLNLIIMPTEQCNFRCIYCYEDFSGGVMPPWVVSGIKSLVMARINDLHTLDVSWFGGEPLLAPEIVKDLSKTFSQLAETTPSVRYRSDMTTNGFLLKPKLFQELVRFGVRFYQVSLDGTADHHDRRRVRRDGAGTFDQIWHNLRQMKQTTLDFKVVMRVHLSPDTDGNLQALVRSISDTFLDDKRFQIYFKGIEKLGGPGDSLDVLSKSAQRSLAETLSSALASGDLEQRVGDYLCYASRANSLVIRSNGDIAKCTVALTDVRNKVGHLDEDGLVHLDQLAIQPWLRGIVSGDRDTLACPWSDLRVDSKRTTDLTQARSLPLTVL